MDLCQRWIEIGRDRLWEWRGDAGLGGTGGGAMGGRWRWGVGGSRIGRVLMAMFGGDGSLLETTEIPVEYECGCL